MLLRRPTPAGKEFCQFIDQWEDDARIAIIASGCFAMDVGGPLRGWTDEEWVDNVNDLLKSGGYQTLAQQATAARMAEAGNNSSELLNWIALTGAVGDVKPDFLEVDGGSGYGVWKLY